MNVAIFSVWLSTCLPSFVRGQGVAEREDTVFTRYERIKASRLRRWKHLIPGHYKVQFAGSIGAAAIGTGWTYGKKQRWETDFMLGYLPRFESKHNKMVFTVKQSYLPWRMRVKESAWVLQPLSCSLFFSSVLGDEFWTREPDRYPKGYYGFSTRIRINLSLGQRVMYDVQDVSNWRVQDISLYYELGACDTDLCTFFGNRDIKFKDVLSLAIGIKFHI